jgi:hypothetical protein
VAEAGGDRPAAVDGDEEQPLATLPVGRVGMLTEEHAVLHGQCGEVAGPRTDHGQGPRRGIRGSLPPSAVLRVAVEGGERLAGRKEELLERVRAHHVVEPARVLRLPQPVVPAILLVDPAERQIGHLREIAVDDGPVRDAWAHHPVLGREGVEQKLKIPLRQPDDAVGELGNGHGLRPGSNAHP